MIAITLTNRPVRLNEDGTWQYAVPTGSSLSKLQAMDQPEGAVALFHGLFDRLGIRITDTDEEITCINGEEVITFEKGIDLDEADYVIQLFAHQIDAVVSYVSEGYSDPLGRFRVARELLNGSPRSHGNVLTKALISNPLFRKLVDAKDVAHLYVISPDPEEEADANYTILFVKGEWLITQGLYGEPERVFRITTEDALELQCRLFESTKRRSLSELRETAKWYKNWRSRVELTPKP